MKVSVFMITYNHERFIAQAIESVLMQETSFDYELVIGEDCSTDRTREIVIDYHRRFPKRIRLLLQEANVGAVQNSSQTLRACGGQYVALLEGDDYWTSPHKLQKQADFLDAHPECSMCFHPVRIFYEDDDPDSPRNQPHNATWPKEVKDLSTIEDIIRSMFIQTASVMLRNGVIAEYPDWFYALGMCDWSQFILYASYGYIGCIREVMSVYRVHSGGMWCSTDIVTKYQHIVSFYSHINAHFKNKYAKIIRPILAEYYFRLGLIYDQSGDWKLAKHYIIRSLSAQALSLQKPRLNEIKMLARFSFPLLHACYKRLARGWAHNAGS